MGYEEDWTAASDDFKAPRGIFSYSFVGGSGTKINVWKVAGNFGGESVSPLFSVVFDRSSDLRPSRVIWQYVDTVRGPLNEGGLYGERMGESWPLADHFITDGIRKDGTCPDSLMGAGKKVRLPPESLKRALASIGLI